MLPSVSIFTTEWDNAASRMNDHGSLFDGRVGSVAIDLQTRSCSGCLHLEVCT